MRVCRILNGTDTDTVIQSSRMLRCVNWWLTTDVLKDYTSFLHQGQELKGHHEDKLTTLLQNVGGDSPVDIEHTRRLESTTQLRQSEILNYCCSMRHNKNSSFNIYGLMYYLSGVKPGVTVVPSSYG